MWHTRITNILQLATTPDARRTSRRQAVSASSKKVEEHTTWDGVTTKNARIVKPIKGGNKTNALVTWDHLQGL